MKYNDWLTEEVFRILTEATLTPDQGHTSTRNGPYASAGANGPHPVDDLKFKGELPDEEEKKHDSLDEDENAGLEMSKGKKFLMVLPKFTPSEAWGNPGSREREEIQDLFTRATWGGQKGIENKIQNLLTVVGKTSAAGPRKIISTLILLESLAAVVNSFSASSAGFVFEGFLAALLEGKQEAEVSAKGNLPIQDLIAFSGKGDLNIPVSLKLLVDSTDVKGSYTNLVDALDEFEQMVYIVAYKRKGGNGGLDISINQFKFDRNNFMEAITTGKTKDAYALFAPKSGKRTAESNYQLIRGKKDWAEKYALLQQTAGYNRKVKPDPKKDEPGSKPGKYDHLPSIDDHPTVRGGRIAKRLKQDDQEELERQFENYLEFAGISEDEFAKKESLSDFFKYLSEMNPDVKESKRIYTVEENRKLLSEARLDEADKGGRQWNISTAQLTKKINDIVGFKSLGTLPGTTEQIEQIAESYADLLTDQLELLFESVSSLSKNVNLYFTATERKDAVQAGDSAQKNAEEAAESMRAAQADDTTSSDLS